MSEEKIEGTRLSRLNPITGVWETIPPLVDVFADSDDTDAIIEQLSEGRETISCTLTFNPEPIKSTALDRWHIYVLRLIMRRERQRTKMSYAYIVAEWGNQMIFPIEEGLCP